MKLLNFVLFLCEMIHALHGLNIYGLYVDEEYTSKSKNYLYSINPFTWEIQDLVDNLSDYDCNEIGTVAALVRLKDSDDDLISMTLALPCMLIPLIKHSNDSICIIYRGQQLSECWYLNFS